MHIGDAVLSKRGDTLRGAGRRPVRSLQPRGPACDHLLYVCVCAACTRRPLLSLFANQCARFARRGTRAGDWNPHHACFFLSADRQNRGGVGTVTSVFFLPVCYTTPAQPRLPALKSTSILYGSAGREERKSKKEKKKAWILLVPDCFVVSRHLQLITGY